MTDAQALTTSPVRASREIRSVDSVIPIFDTARFEHMYRIAKVMAGSSLIPDALRKIKEGNNLVDLPAETVLSNCFLVVNQADNWNADPFAVAGCCSVVHGRLMYEGKLVAAILQAKLKVDLAFQFGKWDNKTQSTDLSEIGEGDLLAVRVGEVVGEDAEGNPVIGSRFVDGYVGDWKTTGVGSPWRPATYRRQCRYRGTREWARAYEPGVMLGVVTDDEIEDLVEMRASAAPQRLTAGFGDETDQTFVERMAAQAGEPRNMGDPGKPEKKAPAKKKGATEETPEKEPEPAKAEAQDAEFEAVVEGETLSREDRLIEVFDAGSEAAQAGQSNEPPEGLDDEEEKHWREGWKIRSAEFLTGDTAQDTAQAETKAPVTIPAEDRVTPAEAAAQGEYYLLSTDTPNGHGQVPYYGRNGKPGGYAVPGAFPVLDAHPKDEGLAPATITGGATAGEAQSDPFKAFDEALAAATSWLNVKQGLKTISKAPEWAAAEDEGRRMVRVSVWNRVLELRETGAKDTDPASDCTLFRCFLEVVEDEEILMGAWSMLIRTQDYQTRAEADREALMALVMETRKKLAGK